MVSSLEASAQAAELSAQSELDKRAKELAQSQAEIADGSARFDAQRKIAFFEELASNDTLSHELPEIMQTFFQSADTCYAITSEALQIATQNQKQLDCRSSLRLHNDIIGNLEKAHNETSRLELSIVHLLDSVHLAINSTIRPILTACLLVLRARLASLTTAQELITSSKSNIEMTLQLESLRITA